MEQKGSLVQTVYINMDDSGQLINNNENQLVFTYGGVFFLSLKEKQDFSRQYRALVSKIKSKYCSSFKNDEELKENHCLNHCNKNCKYDCPELKSNMLKPNDKRRLLNFIKKYDTSVAVVSNKKLKSYIFSSKASKGRFKDYVIKEKLRK